jgi:hypothetical protein
MTHQRRTTRMEAEMATAGPKTYEEFKTEVARRHSAGETVTQIAQWARDFAPLWGGTQQVRRIVLPLINRTTAGGGRCVSG